MSQIKTVTTSAGENKISFDAFYAYVWIKNTGDTDVYIADYSGASAGDVDTAVLPAGEATRLTVKTQDVYVYGATTIEAHAQNFSDVPFSDAVGGGSGGGGSITIDPAPTQGSSNAVSSGGVYTALQNVPQPIDYSTTEQDTGIKWIDGKPVYQKVYYKTSIGTFPNEKPANVDTVISMQGVLRYVIGSTDIITPVYATTSSDYYGFYFSNDDLVLRSPTQGMTDIKATIIMQYTKTTDTVV